MLLLLLLLLSVAAAAQGGAPPPAAPRLPTAQLHTFRYSADVLLRQGAGPRGRGYRISADVGVALAWRDPSSEENQLITVTISNARIQTLSDRPHDDDVLHGATTESLLGERKLAALTKPFFVHLKNGKTKAFYSYWSEHVSIRNLKRGVASLLQLQLRSGKVIENDVSGRCTVDYRAVKGQVTRVKNLETCKRVDSGFTTHSQVLGVSRKSSSVTVFTLEDGFIRSAEAEEIHDLGVNARSSISAKVLSRQTLTRTSVTAGPPETVGNDVSAVVAAIDPELVAVGIVAEKIKSKCRRCPTLMDQWRSLQQQLEPSGLSKASAPRGFLSLIQSVRKANKEQILAVLRNASKTALPQVVDAVTSAQTTASLDAMLDFLNFTDAKGFVLQERFLYACGFASHPDERMLRALLDIHGGRIGSSDIKETVVIIMGALVNKLCQKGGCDLPTVVQVKDLILRGPDSTQVESEVQMYLLALKNSLLPEAVPVFLRFAEAEVGAYNTIALTSLQRYQRHLLTEEVKSTVNRIYHQNRRIYEKNVRAAAADVILSSRPSYMEVKNLLLSIGELPHEMNKYMLSKIQDILRFNMPASKVIRQVMKDMVSHNYNRFAKVGSSSSFSGFMAESADVTSTYSLDILYSGSGILRRSNMNIYGATNGATLHGLQVAIEAQGMESLIAVTPDQGEEDLESFAGMSALLFDVQLRPVTFFRGYSDLMAKMFSMSGEPINVVKGLILLTDHSEVLQLQSGLRASAEFQGGLAIDISGGMEVSLWYRESKTSVNNRGAMVVTGNVTVDMDFLRTGVEASFETEAALDFITTVQFSEYPFLVCIQMEKTTFPYSEYQSRYDSLSSGKSSEQQRSQKLLVPGSEFPLHQENSNMCKRVFDSSW